MPNLSNRSPQNPVWFWFSFLPVLGGLGIAYAGNKSKNSNLIGLGIVSVVVSLLCASSEIVFLIWFAQIGTAFYLKKQSVLILEDNQTFLSGIRNRKSRRNPQETIDINTCSKDDLVYDLGLPIVYANNIEDVRRSGYIFTHIEELHEIAGLPENYLKRLSPLVTFSYDLNKEVEVSWRRLNIYSLEEFVQAGIITNVANKIIEERQKNGFYHSVIEVQRRTGLPISCYRNLI